MRTSERLAARRRDLLAGIERYVLSRETAQNALLRDQLEVWLAEPQSFRAAYLCFDVARALGLEKDESQQLAVIVGLVELAALSLRDLPASNSAAAAAVTGKYGLPLVLNACDGLYALAHMALAEFEALEDGRRKEVALRFDALTLALWERALASETGYFGDWPAVAGAAGRLAAELPALVRGWGWATVKALGDLGAMAAGRTSGAGSLSDDSFARLNRTGLGARERSALKALLEPWPEV